MILSRVVVKIKNDMYEEMKKYEKMIYSEKAK